jgi:hypothetical protein
MTEYDDDTLEQIMREGLEFRAGSAATTLADPPGRDPHAVRRGRGRWVAAAAAAAVVVAGGVTYVAVHGSNPDDGQIAVDPGQVPSNWRYESFDGVQVRVPPEWGWGGAPMGSGDQVTTCGSPVAAALPNIDGVQSLDHAAFVGRPVMMSDACQAGEGALAWPTVSAVWFDSPLPIGTDRSGDQVATTIEVGSQAVTVFAGNDTLRAEILSTAETVAVDGNGCPASPVATPAPGPADHSSPTGLSVCVYDQGRLLWSAAKDAQAAGAYATAFSQATALFDYAKACQLKPSEQWVAIGVDYAGAPTRWDIADFGCQVLVGSYVTGAGQPSQYEAPLVPSTVSPWAGGGVKAYVVGPGVTSADDPLASFFRGVLG